MDGKITETVVRLTPNVELLKEVEVVNLRPHARKRTQFELSFAHGTTQKYVPPARLGYYGHWEYTLPSGLVVVVSVSFQERVASCPDVYRHRDEEVYKPFLKEGAGDRE